MRYLHVISIGLRERFAYRIRFFASLFGAILNLIVLWFVWNSIFAASGVDSINGFTLPVMLTYLVISSCLRPLTFSDIEYIFQDDVISGAICTDMTKPISYPIFRSLKGFSNVLMNALTNSMPIFLVSILILNISLPVNPLAFALSVVLGFFVDYLLAFLTGMWVFWSSGRVWGLRLSRQIIAEILSGALIPLYFFPQWLSNITSFLPFQTLFHIPISIYLGKIADFDILYSIGVQLFWIALLGSICYLVWKKAERKVIVHGG
ncbi:MAG: hypothetical protein ABIE55_00355 [Candidatus Aenigmatarchaeota archaeon]